MIVLFKSDLLNDKFKNNLSNINVLMVRYHKKQLINYTKLDKKNILSM